MQPIDIRQGVQKDAWYTALNPNGKVPAIVDHGNDRLPVFESSAILSYLSRMYDTERRLSFDASSNEYTIAESWIAWQHGGVGPMQGQANLYARFLPESHPFAVQRFVGETERLYGVLNNRLHGRDFVVGPGKGTFSIADIALLGWANFLPIIAVPLDGFPNVNSWLDRCNAREAVQTGFSVLGTPMVGPGTPLNAENVEAAKAAAERTREAKEKYSYN